MGKRKGKKKEKSAGDSDDNPQLENEEVGRKKSKDIHTEESTVPDNLKEEDKVGDVSIDIDEIPERPQLMKRSSSLKEIVIDANEQPKDNVKIDIPDSPGDKEDLQPQFPINDSPPSSPNSAGLSTLPQSSRPVLAEKIGSRPSSAEKVLSIPTSEQFSEMPRENPQPASTDIHNSEYSSYQQSFPALDDELMRSSSPLQKGSFSDEERPLSPSERTSRPSSGNSNNPSDLVPHESRDTILFPPNGITEIENGTERLNSRPTSAENTRKLSSNDRPPSRELSIESSRPVSAQRIPTSILDVEDGSVQSAPQKQNDVIVESIQNADSVMEERPLSKERKKRKSKSRNSKEEVSSIDGDDRQSQSALREKKSITPKRVSISDTIEHHDIPSRENSSEGKQRAVPSGEIETKQDYEETFMPPNYEKERRRSSLPHVEEDNELPWAMYKQMKTRLDEEREKEEDHDDKDDDDSDDNDSKYEPPTNEELPDMYNTMEGLDNDEIELNVKTSPPSILENEKQKIYQQQVSDLKQGLAEEEIKVYLDEFEQRVEQEILMIGNISLEDVQDEEKRLREEHIGFQQEQAKTQRNRQQEIMQAMERAKKYVMSKYKEKYRELRIREEHLMQKDRSYKDEIHRAFRRSESQLKKALKRRKAEVKTMYGDLTFADGQYGGSKGRRWKIDWNRAPQPIQIKLRCLRGVKDKLPASRYVLMVSLYNRLGGNVMKWSNLKGQQWGGATLPLFHDGEFFNIEMKVDQSVFTVCPSKPDMLPGMVLIFELFILRGSVSPTDKVVGWGCFPISDSDFNVIEGKYKTPMLRGDMDPGLDNFQTIEKLMADDLDHWLCNFYFEIVKLPRYMAGQKEYEVELQFTSGLLSSPDRIRTEEENIDGEKAIFGSRSDFNSHATLKSRASVRSGSISSAALAEEESGVGSSTDRSSAIEKKNLIPIIDSGVGSSTGESSSVKKSSLVLGSQVQMFRAENLSTDLRKRKGSSIVLDRDENGNYTDSNKNNDEPYLRPMTSVAASRKLVEEKGLQFSDDEGNSSGTDYEDDDIYALRKTEGFKPVKGQPGMFYKIHHNTPSDVYAKKIYSLMPKTPLLAKQKLKKKLTHLEELNTHSFSVKTPWSNKGRIDHKASRKMQYIGRMLLTELGISQIKSRVFWAMVLMLLLTFWIRMYLHYVGQWVALVALQIPINKFEFLPYSVNLNYQNTLLRTREELALIVIGPFTLVIFFAIMVAISAFIQFLFDRFPNLLSRFIMAFGIQCILDPLFILIVDCILKRYQNIGGPEAIGDAFKLYWHFDRFYNTPSVTLFVSIMLTVFLYFVTTFCAGALLYVYFLKIHNNGRLMDVYWRLNSGEQEFFIPYDMEVSNEELNYVCRKAEQWRGEEGERRKTAVYDYIWEEEEMADEDWDTPNSGSGKKTGAKETTTHVSIHTLHLDGLRELFRHFLKLPDGAIVEVFGEMNIPGIDEGVKQALIKRTTFQSMNNKNNNNNSLLNVNGPRKRFPSGTSSNLSVRKDDLRGKKMSSSDFLLGVPSSSSHV